MNKLEATGSSGNAAIAVKDTAGTASLSGSNESANAQQVVHKPAPSPVPTISFQELKEKLSDLTDGTHNSFQTALAQQTQSIATLHGLIAQDHKTFQAESAKLDESARDRWRQLSGQRKSEVEQLGANLKACQALFVERTQALQKAVQNCLVEKAMLREITKGHVNSWSIGSLSRMTTCMGIPHRAGEIKAALEARKINLGIREADIATSVALPQPPASDSVSKKVKDLSIETICSHEEVAVICEALRTLSLEQIGSSELPRKFYLNYLKKQKAYQGTNEGLKPAVEARLKELDNTDDAQLKQEKTELSKRWEDIQTNLSEISKILDHMKKKYSLNDAEEKLSFSELGSAFTQSINLLTQITAHREQVVLGNFSDKDAEIDQRRALYFADKRKYEDLEAKRGTLMERIVTPRMNNIDPAVQHYQSYIRSYENDMRTVQKNMADLTKLAEMCSKWQADPAVAGSSGWFGALLGGGSPQKAAEKTT